jgi:serine/threonine-protein kinase RsbW
MRKSFTATAKKSSLREMVRYIKAQASAAGFSGKTLERIELVSEEALINIISYAYPEIKKGMIDITCDQTADQFQIVIVDHGIPFDPIANARHVDLEAPLEQRTYGGYGIYLIRKVMDRVSYKRVDNTNVLTMVKRLSHHRDTETTE